MQLEKVRGYFKSYPLPYWISVFAVLTLSVAMLLLNNLSGTPTVKMLNIVMDDSAQVSEALSETEKFFGSYAKMINVLATDSYRRSEDLRSEEWLTDFERYSDMLFESLYETFPYISGYFINIDSVEGYPVMQKYLTFADSRESHISVLMDNTFIYGESGLYNQILRSSLPNFSTIPSYLTGKFELAHTRPLYVNGRFRGIFGITLDLEAISGMYGAGSDKIHFMGLLSRDMEIISSTNNLPPGARLESVIGYEPIADLVTSSTNDIVSIRTKRDDGAWMNIFVKMPTGQVFWESYRLRDSLFSTNMLNGFLAAYAFLCIWVVQKRNGISPFDKFSERFSGTQETWHGEAKIGRKAWFAMQMSMTFIAFALLAFVLMNPESSMWLKLTHTLILAASALGMFFQRENGGSTRTYIYIVAYMFAPLLIHHLSGGFGSQNAGQLIIFCVFSVVLACYALRERKVDGIFSMLVALLFLNAIFEILINKNVEPVFAIRWTTVIFFVGFGVYSITDIYVSETRSLFARLKDAQSALVKKEKMVTLGTLIAGIAHEINTPLSAIKASAEGMEASTKTAFKALLESGKTLSDEDKSYFHRLLELVTDAMKSMYSTSQIRKAKPVLREFFTSLGYQEPNVFVERLLQLEICDVDKISQNRDLFMSENINRLLDMAVAVAPIVRGSYIIRQSANKTSKIIFALKSYSHTNAASSRTWFNVEESIDTALVLLYNQMKGAVKLDKNYGEELPQVFGNPDELGQVWLNLLQNALYAMKGSGVLTIELTPAEGYLIISVIDSGEGITPEVLEHIFEPFYTTKPKGEGSGLGLDICRKIIEEHEGAINIESAPGAGTAVRVRLPAESSAGSSAR